MGEPDNAQIDADIVDYLLGGGEVYDEEAKDAGAHFLSNIKITPGDFGVPKDAKGLSDNIVE